MTEPSTHLDHGVIADNWKRAETAIAKWDTLAEAKSSAEFDVYRDDVANALEGLWDIEHYLESQIAEWKARLIPIQGNIKTLRSIDEKAKRHFYRLREVEKGLTPRPPSP